jgi:hypothetical protein
MGDADKGIYDGSFSATTARDFGPGRSLSAVRRLRTLSVQVASISASADGLGFDIRGSDNVRRIFGAPRRLQIISLLTKAQTTNDKNPGARLRCSLLVFAL